MVVSVLVLQAVEIGLGNGLAENQRWPAYQYLGFIEGDDDAINLMRNVLSAKGDFDEMDFGWAHSIRFILGQ